MFNSWTEKTLLVFCFRRNFLQIVGVKSVLDAISFFLRNSEKTVVLIKKMIKAAVEHTVLFFEEF